MRSEKSEPIETDWSLLRRLDQGEFRAFDGLFEKYRRGLLAYVTGMVADRCLAEDIVQECFLELVRNAKRIRPEQGASGWLYRVARNRAIDALRARKSGLVDGGLESVDELLERRSADPSPSPCEETIARESAKHVRRALEMLPPKERDLLLLRYFGDLKFKEIAQLLHRPLGTVLWQATRSLEKIRSLLTSADVK